MPILSRSGALACLGAALLGWGTAACAAAPRQRPIKGGDVDTGGGTLTAARKYLEGRWHLLTYDITPPGQPAIHLTPANGQGTLVYDEFGNLDIEIRVDDATARTLDRVGIQTTDGMLSEKGHAAVDLQQKTITFMLDSRQNFEANKGPIDLKKPRYWQVDGNILTLTTKGDDGKPVAVGRWEKMP